MVVRLVGYLEQERSGTACRVIDRGVRGRLSRADAKNLCHDAADLGRGIELALTLAALGGEVPHEVLVGIAQDVVTIGAIL